MKKFALHAPSPAMVVAMTALFVALGGTGYAATQLTRSPTAAVAKKMKKPASDTTTDKKLFNSLIPGAHVAFAATAGSAASAGSAATAGSASTATNAGHASTADTATNAGHATSADGLTLLPSGQSESGAFSAAGANSSGAGGWVGAGITYARPLATPIKKSHIIDDKEPEGQPIPHCPGPGQAEQGYLCLYDEIESGVGTGYGYSENEPGGVTFSSPSVGVVLYWPVTGSHPYSGGEYTVTAP